jgi:restriction system protein
MTSGTGWRQYQTDVADHFRKLGFTVAVECRVDGIRGRHTVDVLAKMEIFGIQVTWIAECKLWNTPVEKENVLSLYQVSQDVGADRAFLLSESGFRSGAVRFVNKTNLSLVSIGDLVELARSELAASQFVGLRRSIRDVRDAIHPIHWAIQDNPQQRYRAVWETAVDLMAACFDTEMALNRAATDSYPISYRGLDDSKDRLAGSAEELARWLSAEMEEVVRRAVAVTDTFHALASEA